MKRELLEKLGQAIYIHKSLIKTAQKAKEAVKYFEKLGVFKKRKKR